MEQLQKQKAASLSVIATSTLTAINLGLKFHIQKVINFVASLHLLSVALETDFLALKADGWHLSTDTYIPSFAADRSQNDWCAFGANFLSEDEGVTTNWFKLLSKRQQLFRLWQQPF